MKKYLVNYKNNKFLVEAEEIKNTRTKRKKFSTSSMCISPPNLLGGNLKDENIIYAPMNSKVIDIKVKKRTRVKKGEILLVLEAMKMESEIVSPVLGTVKSIFVKKGQSVSSGERLIEIKTTAV